MLIDHVERYIALRRATGFKLTDPERGASQFRSVRGGTRRAPCASRERHGMGSGIPQPA